MRSNGRTWKARSLSRCATANAQEDLNAYHNRAIATQEIIEELIKLAELLCAEWAA
jgi:hypothetical protein